MVEDFCMNDIAVVLCIIQSLDGAWYWKPNQRYHRTSIYFYSLKSCRDNSQLVQERGEGIACSNGCRRRIHKNMKIPIFHVNQLIEFVSRSLHQITNPRPISPLIKPRSRSNSIATRSNSIDPSLVSSTLLLHASTFNSVKNVHYSVKISSRITIFCFPIQNNYTLQIITVSGRSSLLIVTKVANFEKYGRVLSKIGHVFSQFWASPNFIRVSRLSVTWHSDKNDRTSVSSAAARGRQVSRYSRMFACRAHATCQHRVSHAGT